MEPGKRPTISDVAQRAGVSRTTVSHALNGRGYVDPRTRENVRTAAQQLGYHPNLRAQRLRTGSAQAVGLVASMPVSVAAGPSRLGFFMEVAASAAETALMHGFAMLLVPPLDTQPKLDQFDIDGAIVVEPEENDPATAQLRANGVPVVSLGWQPGARSDIPYIDMQSQLTGKLLLEHLYDQGARRIALLVGSESRHSYLDVADAYEQFISDHALEPLVVRVDENEGEDGGYSAVLALMDSHPGIDGICALVDAFAVGVVRGLKELGRRIPEDVRVVTRYDGLRAQTCQPPLTAVNLNLSQVAELAIELLLEHRGGDHSRHVVPGPPQQLVPRASSVVPVTERSSVDQDSYP
ncbi:LacI family DNA-binding transcriptional regulator [Specibacter cremeus]|uniref:LacI family DNA-binding transcriptional regulator n=1 Tax=Specibacter cremeus TaxID=1629051 RepID=UPI000F76CB19|nr:LacI family DNA-binding transcriptional regulator [Specibacter cremeus]